MKSSIVLILGFICGGLLWAQRSVSSPAEEVFSRPLSPAASGRFYEICAVLSEKPITRGVFSQGKTIARLNRTLVSGGNFIIHAELGILWETLTPFPSVMAVGRDYVVQSGPNGSAVRIDAAGNETFIRLSETISAVFSGDAQALLGGFEVFFTEKGGRWELGLIPRESAVRSFASAITMSGDSVIRRVTLYEQNGDSIRYELSGHVFPGELKESEKKLFAAQ